MGTSGLEDGDAGELGLGTADDDGSTAMAETAASNLWSEAEVATPSTSEERASVEVEREEDTETAAARDEQDLERKVLVLWHLPPGIRRQEVHERPAFRQTQDLHLAFLPLQEQHLPAPSAILLLLLLLLLLLFILIH